MKRLTLSLGGGALLCAAIYVSFFVLPDARATAFVRGGGATSSAVAAAPAKPAPPQVTHLPTPKTVKALYITACYAADSTLRAKLVKLADETEVNALVVDIKDWSGTIAFAPEDPAVAALATGTPKGAPSGCVVRDMPAFVRELHDHNIYAIARLTTFQDPRYAPLHPDQAVQRADGSVWKDKKGIAFVDVGAKPYWSFVVGLAKSAYAIGFDEVNFDYVRFPTDGDIRAAVYPYSGAAIKADPAGGRRTSLRKFFAYLDEQIPDGQPVTSADFFGMTTNSVDDMGIGQYLEDGLASFDYLAPMVYPSHYPATWNGHKNPNAAPGAVVYEAMKFAVDRADKLAAATTTPAAVRGRVAKGKSLRAWIQDFNYGGNYDAAAVRAQIDGSAKAGANGYMVWDPANHYSSTAGALRGTGATTTAAL